MATKATTQATIENRGAKMYQMELILVGDSSLICHAWSQKAKLMILEKQQKKASAGREIRRPFAEFAESLYWLTEKPNLDGLTNDQAREVLQEVIPNSKFGFPTLAFKSAAIDAGFQQGVLVAKAGTAALAKTTARGAIQVLGEMTEINGLPDIREDMVRIGSGTAAIAYRAEFKTWSTTLSIRYNGNAISPEQISNLFDIGGFANGVGDWRPAKDGNHGMFHVEKVLTQLHN